MSGWEEMKYMIRVNGAEEVYPNKLSILEYARAKGYRTERIAVERNGSIVPKKDYAETMIQDGDCLEIVSFVGGG